MNARRSALGLPPVRAADAAAARTLLIEERRRELFLEGRRLGDMIRYQTTPRPAAGSPFPKGGVYGTQLCFPLPDVERNNNPTINGGAGNS